MISLVIAIQLFVALMMLKKDERKRAIWMTLAGALITNGASIFAVATRAKPFGAGDIIAFIALNTAFVAVYFFQKHGLSERGRQSTQDKRD